MRPKTILFACALPLLSDAALSQQPLVIPRDANEMRKLMRDGDSRCPQCGVVMDVRMAGTVGGAERDARDDMDVGPTAESGLGHDLQTSPLLVISGGSAGRPTESKPAVTIWRITVRYDNGTYATFDQTGMPTVAKGDRVQTAGGRVERR